MAPKSPHPRKSSRRLRQRKLRSRRTSERKPAPEPLSRLDNRSGRLRKSSQLAKVKSLMKKAARLNLDSALRKGAVVHLPAEGDVVFTGDIHGHKDNMNRIIEITDLDHHPGRHLVIQEITHNIQFGLVDRDISFRVLERVAQLKVDFPEQVHVIMGNHELSELTGKKILKDNHMLNKMFAQGIISSYGEGAREVKQSYDVFFQSLLLGVRTATGIFFSHSTPAGKHLASFDPRVFDIEGEVLRKGMKSHIEKLVWGRDFSQKAADTFAEMMGARILLVGHEACSKGFKVPNTRHIILDSKDQNGCFLHLSLERAYSHNELVKRIRRVNEAGAELDEP